MNFSKFLFESNISDLKSQLNDKYKNVSVSLISSGDSIEISKIIVSEDNRERGVGTAVMKYIVKYADDRKLTLLLSPTSDFGGNKNRLIKFYKRFGFVENKGRTKDYEISTTMYRVPN